MSSQPPAIVLVEPQHPGNIGAVCRSMQNYGFERLILVNPTDPLSDACKTFALHAFTVAQQAEVYGSLSEALATCNLSLGFTRREGRYRNTDGPYHEVLQKIFERQHNWLPTSAFVFGREDSGLTKEEAMQCSFLVNLPTSSIYPSMNLSHAVTCACYEYHRQQLTHSTKALPEHDINDLLEARHQTFASLTRLLDAIDFYSVEPPPIIHQHLQHWLEKSLMSAREIRLLGKLAEKLKRIHKTRQNNS